MSAEIGIEVGEGGGREIEVEVGENVEKAAGKAAGKAAEDAAEDAADTASKSVAKRGFNLFKKGVSKGADLCLDDKKTCASVIGVSALAGYVAIKNKEASESERACKAVCLPSNWPGYIAKTEQTIKYRDIPVTGEDGKPIDFPADEVCKSPTKDCDKFCDNACHVSRSLLGDIPFLGNIEDTMKDLFTQMFSGTLKYITIGIIIVIAMALVIPLLMKLA
jgi:hypothetical protein